MNTFNQLLKNKTRSTDSFQSEQFELGVIISFKNFHTDSFRTIKSSQLFHEKINLLFELRIEQFLSNLNPVFFGFISPRQGHVFSSIGSDFLFRRKVEAVELL